ncbi:MAG: hypothetical protein ACU84Q_16585 [Gammaproteobacteria bacterium]
MVADSSIVHAVAIVSRAFRWREADDEPVPKFHKVAVATVRLNDATIDGCMGEADGPCSKR